MHIERYRESVKKASGYALEAYIRAIARPNTKARDALLRLFGVSTMQEIRMYHVDRLRAFLVASCATLCPYVHPDSTEAFEASRPKMGLFVVTRPAAGTAMTAACSIHRMTKPSTVPAPQARTVLGFMTAERLAKERLLASARHAHVTGTVMMPEPLVRTLNVVHRKVVGVPPPSPSPPPSVPPQPAPPTPARYPAPPSRTPLRSPDLDTVAVVGWDPHMEGIRACFDAAVTPEVLAWLEEDTDDVDMERLSPDRDWSLWHQMPQAPMSLVHP